MNDTGTVTVQLEPPPAEVAARVRTRAVWRHVLRDYQRRCVIRRELAPSHEPPVAACGPTATEIPGPTSTEDQL